MKRLLGILFFLTIASFSSMAQVSNPVNWSFQQKQIETDVYELHFNASIKSGYHLYSDVLPEGGPIATSFHFEQIEGVELIDKPIANSVSEKVLDKAFDMELEYFSNSVTFIQKVKVLSQESAVIEGFIEFMSCDDETCTPPAEAAFSFNLSESGSTNIIEQNSIVPLNSSKDNNMNRGLHVFLLVAFLAGLAAILTPCVFPMIPMTVSFFMRGSENRGKAIKSALFFGISIVLIYTLLGALFSIGIFGPNVGSVLSTHWLPNALFFILFLVFALSFFGLFELVLPSSLVNKTDAKADKGGLIGAFFMALTTVIVSFSCTGPFIGYLIIEAVQGGGVRPMLGMFFFGLAFATPFTLLAVFPSALKKLPKSGGWLNAVKVVFAFILLAFGLKFLSNIDQVYGFNLLNRDIYLSIWIVIFFMLGLYLLGKIKFAHDSDLKHLGVGRLLLSMTVFVFTVYLFTGLLGAPLKGVSSLLPPQSASHYSMHTSPEVSFGGIKSEICSEAKYADKLHLPHGLNGYFDLEQGLACAKEQNKPAFVVFKGHACSNCKKMENTVWINPETLSLLSENYVVIALYTDDRTSLPQNEWAVSDIDGRALKTMGRKNLDILMSDYNKNSIPFHVIIKPDGTKQTLDVTYDNDVFRGFIKNGLK